MTLFHSSHTSASGLAAITFGIGSFAVFTPTDLRAQDTKRAVVDTFAIPLTFAVPESPAFTFLSIAPAKVSRASSARDLGAALVNGIDSTGRVVTGVAIGATLWTVLSRTISLDSYQTNPAAYAFANTQISIGSARSSGDSADTDVAVGFRTTFFDASDPMRDRAFTDTLTASLRICADSIDRPNLRPPGEVTGRVSTTAAAPDAGLDCAENATDVLRRHWFQKNWNRAALTWGTALGWRVPGSELGDMDPLGVSTWLAGALPLGTSGQLLGQLQLDHRNARDTLAATSIVTYGARAIRGTKDHNFFVELAGTARGKANPTTSRSNVQWSGGVELQLTEGYWVSTGFGKRYAAQGKPDRVVLIANVRWGVSSASRLGMRPASR